MSGASKYVRPQGVSMVWLDDNTVFLASGATNKYTIVTTGIANRLEPGDLDNAVYNDIPSPDANGQHGFATISGNHLYSWPPQAEGAVTLNYYIDHCTVDSAYELAGAPDSLFINSGANGEGAFDTLETTGYFFEQGDASIGVPKIDANGVRPRSRLTALTRTRKCACIECRTRGDGGVENSTGDSATIAYTYVAPEDMYIVLHNVQYTTSPLYRVYYPGRPGHVNGVSAADRGYLND